VTGKRVTVRLPRSVARRVRSGRITLRAVIERPRRARVEWRFQVRAPR
jgi:hypothetical protein